MYRPARHLLDGALRAKVPAGQIIILRRELVPEVMPVLASVRSESARAVAGRIEPHH